MTLQASSNCTGDIYWRKGLINFFFFFGGGEFEITFSGQNLDQEYFVYM